jgi:hypothetical protein
VGVTHQWARTGVRQHEPAGGRLDEGEAAVKKVLLIATLALLALLIPGQLGYDPALLAATTDFSIGWTSVSPATVPAGQTAKIDTRVQARVKATVTVEAAITDAAGRVAWQRRWDAQAFNAWQGRAYSALWPVPAAQPAGAYTLAVRVLGPSGEAMSAVRTVAFKVGPAVSGAVLPTATPAPATTPAPTAPPAPAPTATPAPNTNGHPIRVTGSATFVSQISAALDLMKAKSPADYTTVMGQLQAISEGSSALAWVTSRSIQLSAGDAAGVNWAGGQIVHETYHVKNYYEGRAWYGCEGEKNSLRPQADYLDRIGDAATAAYIRSLIGVWGC